ncbi:hypothetical protein D3C76_1460120 [compost metagenome]
MCSISITGGMRGLLSPSASLSAGIAADAVPATAVPATVVPIVSANCSKYRTASSSLTGYEFGPTLLVSTIREAA